MCRLSVVALSHFTQSAIHWLCKRNALLSATGQTHQKYPWGLYSLFSENQFVSLTQISRISRKTHRYTRVCHPVANTRQGRQARAKRRAICGIREICVKFNYLCKNILVRLPCLRDDEVFSPRRRKLPSAMTRTSLRGEMYLSLCANETMRLSVWIRDHLWEHKSFPWEKLAWLHQKYVHVSYHAQLCPYHAERHGG